MSDDAIAFEKLDVRRAPGFETAGFSVEDLSVGINVVYGPNASGKTTMARSIQSLLWPKSPALSRAELVAHLETSGAHWRVGLDRGRTSWQRDGADVAGGPRVPPSDQRDRYYLCLHELLQADDAGFAEYILRESAGGYDISKAGEALGFSSQTPIRNQATRDVEDAKEAASEAAAKQAALRREEQRLRELDSELEEAKAAGRRQDVLRLAIEYRAAEQRRSEAAEALEDFPGATARVRGDEQTIVETQNGREAQAKRDESEARAKIAQCEANLAESPVPEGGLPVGKLQTLEGYISELADLKRQRHTLEGDLAGARARRDEARRLIGDSVDPEQAASLDTGQVNELARLARREDEARGEHRAFAKLEELLETDGVPENLAGLRDGMRALQRWLSSPDAEDSADDGGEKLGLARKVMLGCAVIIVVVSVALGLVVNLAWLALLLLAAVMGWLFVSLQRPESSAEDLRAVFRKEFEKLAVPRLQEWSEEQVERHLQSLAKQWAQGMVEAEKAREWASHRTAHEELEVKVDATSNAWSELADALGLDVADGPAALHVLASHILDWQARQAEVADLAAKLENVESQMRGRFGRLSGELTGFNFEAVRTHAEAEAQVAALEEAANAYAKQLADLDEAGEALEDAVDRQSEAREVLAEVFDRLELDEGDVRGVARLCEQQSAYEEAKDEYTRAEGTAEDSRKRLESHSEYSAELTEQELDVLREELHEVEEKASAKDELIAEAQDIRTRIDAAKQSHQVEEKRAEYRGALDRLERRRDDDYGEGVGALLADYVHEQTRDYERPKVFRRARELFSEITHGRYRLQFDDGDQPAFRAWDTTAEVGRSLDELSNGTRVQLLLAVRVAFVKHQEEGLKLPLVLDETLANSDDERAMAIIEAVQRIAEKGRQVFYFTAQRDEVRKWREALEVSEIDSRFINLGAMTGAAAPDDRYGFDVAPPAVAEVSAPDGMDHAAYGAALGVAGGLSPRAPLGQAHLWYLVDDPETLHRLLEAGYVRWGQLRELERMDGLHAVGMSEDEFVRAAAAARALEAHAEAWRVGRGKPVTREALEATDAVTDTFIERVVEKCSELEGQGKALLVALQKGEVSGFRTNKREELAEYLQANGYIDPAKPLNTQEVWNRVLSAVASYIERSVLDLSRVREVIGRAVGSEKAVAPNEPQPV